MRRLKQREQVMQVAIDVCGYSATEADIISFCRGHMSGFKTPKAVVFGTIPKTSTGKIQKFMLREKEWAGHGQRVKG